MNEQVDRQVLAAEQWSDDVARIRREFTELKLLARDALQAARDNYQFCDRPGCDAPVCVAWHHLEQALEDSDG